MIVLQEWLVSFLQDSKKIHIDIDPSSINKVVKVDVAIVGDAQCHNDTMLKLLKKNILVLKILIKKKLVTGGSKLKVWREKKSLSFRSRQNNDFTSVCSATII